MKANASTLGLLSRPALRAARCVDVSSRPALHAARCVAAAGLLSALAGCGAEGAAGPPVAGLPAAFEGPGVYTVPAAPSASFPVSRVRVGQSEGTVTLSYDLPGDLAGYAQRVELSGAADGAGAIVLAGDAGTSTCAVSEAKLSCDEQLFGVHVDAEDACSALPHGDPRCAAVRAFSVDPIGVLGVPLSGAAAGDGASPGVD